MQKSEEGRVVGRIWNGGDVAQEMLRRVRDETASLLREGRPPPTLVEIRVSDSPPHNHIQRLQEEACRASGIAYQVRSFPLPGDLRVVAQALAELNADPGVTGITMHAPAPVSLQAFAKAITPEKDVDGWHPLNLGRLMINRHKQRVTRGMEVVHLLKQAGVELLGAHVICVGNATGLAGVFALLCLHENATITAGRSSAAWSDELLRCGDVLLIDTDDWPPTMGTAFKPGAVIIDARRSPSGQALPFYEQWLEVVSLLIPVPDGIGPATVALRLSSLVSLYRAQEGIPSGS